MIRTSHLLAAFMLLLLSCSKEDEPTKSDPYRNITFRIEAKDSFLTTRISYAVYEGNQKKGIDIDTSFVNPGIYTFPVKALVGVPASLFALSYRSSQHNLQILSGSNVIAHADSLPLVPATPLDTMDRWFTTITGTP